MPSHRTPTNKPAKARPTDKPAKARPPQHQQATPRGRHPTPAESARPGSREASPRRLRTARSEAEAGGEASPRRIRPAWEEAAAVDAHTRICHHQEEISWEIGKLEKGIDRYLPIEWLTKHNPLPPTSQCHPMSSPLLRMLDPFAHSLSRIYQNSTPPRPGMLTHDIEGAFNNTHPRLLDDVLRMRMMPI
jgi:hypothetical protein